MITSFTTRKYNRFDFLALYILIIGVGILPFFFLPTLPALGGAFKSFFAIAVALLSTLCWSIARLTEQKIHIPLNRSLGLLGVFVLLSTLSGLFAVSPLQSFFGEGFEVGSVVSIVVFGLYVFLGSYYLHTYKARIHCALSLAIGTGVVLFSQLIFFLLSFSFVPAAIRTNPFFTLAGTTEELGTLAVLALIGALLTFEFLTHKRLVRVLAFVGGVLALIVLSVVHLWPLWLVALLGSLSIFVYTILLVSREENATLSFARFPVFSLAVLVIAIPFVTQNTLIGNLAANVSGIPFSDVSPSFVSTAAVAGQAALHDPLFGIGPMHFTEAWFHYLPTSNILGPYWALSFEHGWSFISTLSITHGLLAFLALLSFLGYALFSFFKQRQLLERDSAALFSTVVFTLTSTFFCALLLVGNPGIATFVIGAVLFGGAIASTTTTGTDWTFSFHDFRGAKYVFLGASVIGILCLCVIGTLLTTGFVARVYAVRATVLMQNNKSANAFDALGTAITIDARDLYYRQYVRQLLGEIGGFTVDANVAKTHAAEIQKLFASALSLADRAVAMDPHNYQNILVRGEAEALGVSLGITELYPRAEASFETLAGRMQRNASIRFSQARLATLVGNEADATKYFAAALAIKPNLTEAYLLQAQLAFQKGDLARAADILTEANKNDTQNATVLLNRAFVSFKQGSIPNALQLTAAALSFEPRNKLAILVQSYLYAQSGDIARAKAVIADALRLAPKDSDLQLFQTTLESGRALPSPFGEVVAPAVSDMVKKK